MKKKKVSGLFLLFVLMITFLVVSNEVVKYHFVFYGYPIYMSVFIYPFLFLIGNIITRTYGEKETIKAVLIALAVQISLFIISGFIMGDINYDLMIATGLGFLVSQAVNIFICASIEENKPHMMEYKFFQYAFVILLDNLLFVILMKDFSDIPQLVGSLAISYFVKLIICIFPLLIEKTFILNRKKTSK